MYITEGSNVVVKNLPHCPTMVVVCRQSSTSGDGYICAYIDKTGTIKQDFFLAHVITTA